MRYFLELSYNGSAYHGWQIQPNAITVQQTLEEKLSLLLKQKTRVFGAGRTDTGVHAKQMFAHFDCNQDLRGKDFLHRYNQFLPKDIAIKNIHLVKDNAHARFDAIARAYEYHISLEKNPLTQDFSWQLTHTKLDVSMMNQVAQELHHYSDFTSFSKLHTDVKTNICKIHNVLVTQEQSNIFIYIKANRFLRNMVRAIVGTLVNVGKGKTSHQEFKMIVEKKDRSFAGSSAPARALFLSEVHYSADIFL